MSAEDGSCLARARGPRSGLAPQPWRGRLHAFAAALWVVALWASAPAASERVDRFDTVVLDAGHGGDDEGARGAGGLVEKDLVLDLTRRLGKRLEARGLRVVLTRHDDAFVPLERRTAIANDARADLFLSIHANAARTRGARGVETYFLSLEASDEAARQVALRENAAFAATLPASASDDPLVSILGDLIATEQLFESDEMARLAIAELAGDDDEVRSRGVKQAPFVVLMGLRMPASLVEVGFLSNPEDERSLRSGQRRDELADALARAVVEFGRRYDARRGAVEVPAGSR